MQNISLPCDVLAIGAHPDDVEVGCGGTLIRLTEEGHRCGLVVLTLGEMGTGGTVDIRKQEVHNAAAIMGVEVLGHFDWGDTRLEDTYAHRMELAAIIRQARPKIILAPYPIAGHGRRQSHPDHVAAGLIAINASNIATLKKAEIAGEPHQVQRIFHYFLPPGVTPDFVVDITAHYDRWVAALSAHASQFRNPEKNRDYIEHLSAMARSFGSQARCKYGLGYSAAEPLLIGNLMDLVKQEEMKG